MILRHSFLCALGLAFAGGTAMAADVGGRPYYAEMTGAAEVPGPGDPDGSGSARITVNPGKAEVCWELKVAGIATATMAHIHQGGLTEAGGVVLALSPPAEGASSGCATVDRDLATAIFENPDAYYVNVHNADFPAGALRGQLSARKPM